MPENTEEPDYFTAAVETLEGLSELQDRLVVEHAKPRKQRDKKRIKQIVTNIQINVSVAQLHATLAVAQRMPGSIIIENITLDEPTPAAEEAKPDLIGDILSNVDPADMLRKAASFVDAFAPKPRPVKDSPQA